jgi:hypothetical protein
MKWKITGLCEQFYQWWYVLSIPEWTKTKGQDHQCTLAHHFTQKRQALTLQSEENYLVVCSDIKGSVHHASSNGANGQPLIPHRYSGAFIRKSVLLKTSFGLTCGFFIMTMYLVIHQYQWCSFLPQSKL